MPNQNTIGRLVGGGSPIQGVNAIPSQVPASASAFIATNQPGNAAVLQVGDVGAQPTGAQTYGSGFDGFPFMLRVAWKVTTKASCNVTVAIVVNSTSSTTYTAGNVIATTGAVAYNTMSGNGWLEAKCLWDSTYQKVTAVYQGEVGATTPAVVAYTTGTNAVAVTAQSSLLFSLALTFSDQTAGTTMTITEFTAEQV